MGPEKEVIEVRKGEEINVRQLEEYLRQSLPGLPNGSLEVKQFSAGVSNLTYLLRIGEWEAVMRRPPFGPLPPKAHDMGREFRFLELLHPVFPLAPRPYLYCSDPGVLGAPFFIMERRKGIVLNDAFPSNVKVDQALCRHLSYMVVDTLAELHQVDVKASGLDQFGHPEGFVERQVRGWISRYERVKTDEHPVVPKLTQWLLENIPTSGEVTLIHNDFKLNNILFSADLSSVQAVVDWEMATIGDPLFDLGVTLSYWVESRDSEWLRQGLPTVTVMQGFLNREEMAERYARRTGRDLSSLSFYVTFAYFKLAVVLQQIYYRWKNGQTKDNRFSNFGQLVKHLIYFSFEQSRKTR